MRYFRSSDEMFQGSDPNDASDNGLPPPPDSLVEISFHIYGIAGYTPGYKGPNAAISIDNAGKLSAPQRMNLVVEGLPPYSLCDSVEFDILETTAIPGFCMNSASGGTEDDYSLSATTDDRGPVAGTMSGNACTVPFYCKDFGGWCRVRAVCRKNGVEVLTLTNTVPADVNNNKISDKWEKNAIALHNETYANDPLTWEDDPYADPDGDNEPAALGNRRTDGSYSHADTGDGLSVFDEYRGYLLDGGADFTATRHKRLSPALKELLVQVNEQGDMASDVGTGPAANPAAFSAFNKTQTMQAVAQFYCHPTRGAGIDLYWVNRPFVPLVGPSIMGRPNAYRYTGDMVYTPKPGTSIQGDLNGSTWISADVEYRYSGITLEQYRAVFPLRRESYLQMMHENRDMKLSGFVPLLLLSRDSNILRMNNGGTEVRSTQPNAFTILEEHTDNKILQGSIVNLVAIAEECPFDATIAGVAHYTGAEFREIAGYSIAHELCHLLCGPNHNTNVGTVFGKGPYLSTLIAPSDELLQINLKIKRGVTP